MSATRTRSVALPWPGQPFFLTLDVLAPAVLLILAAAGLGVSGYLTYTHWADQTVACAGFGSCELVQTSEYSTLGPVPVALLGALTYIGLGGLAGLALLRRSPELDWPVLAFWAGALAGTAYSAYLTYVELFVLEAICIWCVASAAIITGSWLIASGYALTLERPSFEEETEDGA